MSRDFSNHLAGQIGESLVVAELGRREIVATAFAGNVPDIDLLAYKDGKTAALQVKAWRKGDVSFDASRFLKIRHEDGRQIVDGPHAPSDEGALHIFVQIGLGAGQDRFFILPHAELLELIERRYRAFLAKHDGIRPRNAASTHTAVRLDDLLPYENQWYRILPTEADTPAYSSGMA